MTNSSLLDADRPAGDGGPGVPPMPGDNDNDDDGGC
jgi:hypothetical protein